MKYLKKLLDPSKGKELKTTADNESENTTVNESKIAAEDESESVAVNDSESYAVNESEAVTEATNKRKRSTTESDNVALIHKSRGKRKSWERRNGVVKKQSSSCNVGVSTNVSEAECGSGGRPDSNSLVVDYVIDFT